MSNKADIEAVVGAFVEDLADLVRRAALEEVRRALGAPAAAARTPRPEPRRTPAKAAPVSRRLAEPPAAEPTPRVAVAPAPEPAPPRRRLDPQRRGRLIVVPSSSSSSQPPPRARESVRDEQPARAPAEAAPQPKAAVAPPEPTPARKWVVVRRPARDRAATATNGNGGAPDSSDAPAPPSAEPPTQPVPQQPAAGSEGA